MAVCPIEKRREEERWEKYDKITKNY